LDLMKDGYPVKVYILKASNYGDAQDGERLFIVVSRGDVPLPGRPQETHGPGPDLAPVATAQSAIAYLMDDTVL
jgi:site-specific DNA-cytosine methylase